MNGGSNQAGKAMRFLGNQVSEGKYLIGCDDPFPHWIVRGHWGETDLTKAYDAVNWLEGSDFDYFDNSNERKKYIDEYRRIPAAARMIIDELQGTEFVQWLEELTGIKDLIPDITGGGIHRIDEGGLLGTHIDFNRAPNGLYRRLNCLLYLNKVWSEENGGALELRRNKDDAEPAVSVLPEFNTMVIFETSGHSWHGHPEPLPGPHPRLSLAMYYYTEAPPDDVAEPHTTIFA